MEAQYPSSPSYPSYPSWMLHNDNTTTLSSALGGEGGGGSGGGDGAFFPALEDEAILWIHSNEARAAATVFAVASLLISAFHIAQHVTHYTMPGIQIYVVRIIFICPMYAVSSALALWLGPHRVFAEIIRDIYEAFVIYSFMNLILEFCGGEADCIYQIENEAVLPMPWPLCFLRPVPRDARFMRMCQRGVLQFAVLKPIMALLDAIMILVGGFELPAYQYFEMVVYNISYAWALYMLYVFYLAIKQLILDFRPILKFTSVKVIIFATYYQSLAVRASSLPMEETVLWNDFILCVEMVLFAALLVLAFPYSEFQGGTPDGGFFDNFRDVLKMDDVMEDLYRNFTPVYHDYGLQRSEKEGHRGGQAQARGGHHSLTRGHLDEVAVEMSHRYRGRNRRFAFNSLLRGERPIRARLRSGQADSSDLEANSTSGADVSGHNKMDCSTSSATSHHGLLSSADRSERAPTTPPDVHVLDMRAGEWHQQNAATPSYSGTDAQPSPSPSPPSVSGAREEGGSIGNAEAPVPTETDPESDYNKSVQSEADASNTNAPPSTDGPPNSGTGGAQDQHEHEHEHPKHGHHNHHQHQHPAAYHGSTVDGKAFGVSRQHGQHISSAAASPERGAHEDYLLRRLERMNAAQLTREESVRLRTHGIGIIVSSMGGIGVREKHEFPTEDEMCLNRQFLAGRDEVELAEKQRRVQKYRSEAGGSFLGLARFASPSDSPPSGNKEGAKVTVGSGSVVPATSADNEEEFYFGISGLVDAEYLLQNDETDTYRDDSSSPLFVPSDTSGISPISQPLKLTLSTKKKTAPKQSIATPPAYVAKHTPLTARDAKTPSAAPVSRLFPPTSKPVHQSLGLSPGRSSGTASSASFSSAQVHRAPTFPTSSQPQSRSNSTAPTSTTTIAAAAKAGRGPAPRGSLEDVCASDESMSRGVTKSTSSSRAGREVMYDPEIDDC